MVNLIFDRKETDVERLKILRDKVRNRTATTDEYEEWLTSLKGAYNNTDLNRVGVAINYLSNLLNDYGYVNTATARTDWEIGEKPNPEQMADYLNNLNKLKTAFYVKPSTPNLPKDMGDLLYSEANNIEKFLFDIDELLRAMTKTFIYSGVAGAGQNRVWQQRFRRPVSEIEVYTLTNIIPDPSFENNQWSDATYSTVERGFGARSLYFATGTTVVANIEIPRPIVGHKYYGRRYIKSTGDNQPGDSRFEVWGADGENKNWVYAWNRGYHPDWEFNSAIHEIKGVDYVDRTIIRCFNVGTTADTWVDGLMLIDLTECFGAGKEPNVFWCDRNIPYFEGTKTIEVKKPIGLNYKVFGNVEQATRSGKNLLIKNGLSTPLTDSDFWNNASATTILEDGWCRIEIDNTSGTSTKYGNQFTKMGTISDIIANETYSIYYEIRNLEYVNGNFYLNLLGDETSTIWLGAIYISGLNIEGKKCAQRKTKADLTGKTLALRNFLSVSAGNKVSLEYRIMIVKGSYTLDTIGDYEPYGVMPSPPYPSEVYGLGRNGIIELKQKIGDNLVKTKVGSLGNLNIKTNLDGSVTINGILESFGVLNFAIEPNIYFKKGVYSVIVENDKNKTVDGDFFYYYKNDTTRLYMWKENTKVKTKEFTEDVMFDIFGLYLKAGTYDNVTYKIQIVKGSEYKPYIPFIEVNKHIDLTNHEPLMKLDDVEDYVDYENNRIVRNVGKYVFNGTENLWQDRELTNSFRYYTGEIIKTLSVDKKALCSHFVQSTTTNEINGIDKEKFALFNNTQIVLRINKTIATTISEVQSFLANQYNNGTPVTVYYPLAEPYYEEIDLPSIQKIPGEYSLTAYDEYLDGRVEKE